jgi:hypothetical protein
VRLTLRTLLAYLDDTLEPAQAKLIGQKVAESDTAQELIERIKQVTRTRRLTAPPATGPGGKIDPNTIAEYLDNAVTAEQSAEVEQICLASDVHLAEVAACHQILTLVLGEPPLVPPTAKQRMYGLAKGPEAIPFRKPPMANAAAEGEYPESRETDEALRMGLPPFRRSAGWRQRAALWVGGLVAAGLLVFALWQILHYTQAPDNKGGNHVALADGKPKPKADGKGGDDKKPPPSDDKDQKKQIETPADKKNGDKKNTGEPEDKDKKNQKQPIVDPMPPVPPEAPVLPPSKEQVRIASYLPPAGMASSVLLQQDDGAWRRIDLKKPQVYTGRPLLSLPGYRSSVEVLRAKKPVARLTLWGTLPEQWPSPPLQESFVTLHENKDLDLDLTLHRGRIVVSSLRGDGPIHVRVRFNNPTESDQLEHADLTLDDKGSEVLVDRWSYFATYEPYYKDKSHPNRVGPTAGMGFIVMSGHMSVKTNDETFSMTEPPGPALLLWNSQKGINRGPRMPKVPEWISASPPLPPGVDLRRRSGMLNACDELNGILSTKDVNVGLTEALASRDENLRALSVRCRGALDDYAELADLLTHKSQDVRLGAIDTLERWIVQARNNDYLLAPELKSKFPREWEKMMELLHGFSAREVLTDYLQNQSQVLREMAALRLARLDAAKKAAPGK